MMYVCLARNIMKLHSPTYFQRSPLNLIFCINLSLIHAAVYSETRWIILRLPERKHTVVSRASLGLQN